MSEFTKLEALVLLDKLRVEPINGNTLVADYSNAFESTVFKLKQIASGKSFIPPWEDGWLCDCGEYIEERVCWNCSQSYGDNNAS